MIHRLNWRHMTSGFPDHNRNFALIVKAVGRCAARYLQSGTMPDKCLAFLAKQDDVFRAGRGHAINGVGLGIVHTNTDNLARVWNGRLECDLGDGDCCGQIHGAFQRFRFFSIQQVAQGRVLRNEAGACRSNGFTVEHTIERLVSM